MSGRNFEVRGLDEWQRGLLRARGGEVDAMKDRILRTAGLRTLEYLDNLTPVRTGRLKGSMTMGGRDNVFQLQVGQQSYVFVGTNVEYAMAVNDGHTQKKGRFVPGYWSSGTFHYQPGANTGMVLTGKVIPGARMMEKSMDYMRDDIDQIIEFEFRRLFSQLFG